MWLIRILLILTLSTCFVAGWGQPSNPCNVKAGIWPANADSVVPIGTVINFTSTSTNATSYQWLLDGRYVVNTRPSWQYGISAGMHTISLVAINGNCTDTATVVYFCAGEPHSIDSIEMASYGFYETNEYGTCMDDTPDGGFILGGYTPFVWCGERALLVKLKERGCVDWSKTFATTYCNNTEILFVRSAPDSTYYVLLQNGELLKLDKSGNLLWNRRWKIQSQAWGYVSFTNLAVDDNGFVYGIAPSINNGWVVVKVNGAGNLVWSKFYRQGVVNANPAVSSDYSYARGILYTDKKLYITGLNIVNNGPQQYYSFVTRLDAGTGQLDWQYGYCDDGNQPNLTLMTFDQPATYDTLLMVSGYNKGQWVTLLDHSGNVRKCINARFPSSYGPKATRAEADRHGNIYIMQWTQETLGLQPYFAYYTNFVKIDTALNKHWGMVYSSYGRGYFADAALNNKGAFAAMGMEYGMVTDGIFSSRDFRLLKVDTPATFPSLNCNFQTLNYTVSEEPLRRLDFQWAADSVITLENLTPTDLVVKDGYVQSRFNCPDFLDSCSFMKISGPRSLCSFTNTYTYKVHRNRKCALTPNWKLSPNVSIVSQTDTTITLQFPGFGTYNVFCSLGSCVPVADSLLVSIVPKTSTLNLGRDTVICSNTTITLHAGTKFLAYRWQNGSSDSVLKISAPGLYWVEAYDSCANALRDSITISSYDGLSFSIGPDRTKCNDDTLHLEASPGFLNYSWSNNYNISSLNGQRVVVSPATDTAYYVKAEKLPGCFAYDTVRVRVYRSPAINLGPDVSFCRGDSAVFDAGGNFLQYTWSNGDTSRFTMAKTVGRYSVMGRSAEGCKSYDTVQVLQVYPLPVVRLDKGNVLCEGDIKTLDAGNFSSWLWQDGSTGRTFTARSTGTYTVLVTDNNGCKGGDTTAILTMLSLPGGFLPPDTAICSYGTLVLKPVTGYKGYLWSTGESAHAVTITRPGHYWLQVQDFNNCTGRDSIRIGEQQCLSGFYIPTAFTPNGDGTNDVFRPLLFGRVNKYQFIIYNRWGQVIFQSSELQRGWDGRINGVVQVTGTYVWSCTYQMQGEAPRMEKGTVLLMK